MRDTLELQAKRDEKRYHALVELVETETAYLEHLRSLVKVRPQKSLPLALEDPRARN